MMQNSWIFTLLILWMLQVIACGPEETRPDADPRFVLVPSDSSNLKFSNTLHYDKDFNIYTYRNFYNGGGIAVGDLNMDGLTDVYFTANMEPNRLFLNTGSLRFRDITASAKVEGQRAWSTGVTIADVNGDGWLDIYVCNSGDLAGDNKQNELFINLGIDSSLTEPLPRFVEQASEYGLADQGYGTHAVFFDYDLDGDLDCYLLNNSYRSIFDFNRMKNQRPVRDEMGGDKLLRNDNNHFVDVSEEAGIFGSEIGFGLGVTVGDVNRDGWPDLFVSNDFFERDYLYINNKDGSFTEDLENQIRSLSVASMGADIADINNDGFPEIFVTEMLPEQEDRVKTKMTFESWDRYQYNLKNGYYHQFTRNVLQLNLGDGTFSEIGRLADVEATDWSWGALMADFDNDGWKDLFIANGLYQDIIDQDYINYVSNEEIVKQVVSREGVNYKKLIDTIPSNPVSNYLFRNKGDLTFENVAEAWGLDQPSHSNGAVYADLDNDGDLEILVNNVNAEAFLYKNLTTETDTNRHYIQVTLSGKGRNPDAIGSKVTVFTPEQKLYQEHLPVRGFQSSVDHKLTFGLGINPKIDSILIEWPDGSFTLDTQVGPDQAVEYDWLQASVPVATQYTSASGTNTLFEQLDTDTAWMYLHRENPFVDFDRDRLLYHMMSTDGPKICVGDVNADGLEDFFIGGAANAASALYIQTGSGTFKRNNVNLFDAERASEDLDCTFFDADQDGDPDLYVVRGGNEFLMSSNLLTDQLYLNDGEGNFKRSPQYLPTLEFESTSCVRPADYDGDGDMDLFVGVRLKPGNYGRPCHGYVLENNGKGVFRNVTSQIAPNLLDIGMVTDAAWLDFDSDQDLDLVVLGDWMPICFFENRRGKFSQIEGISGISTEGWWNCLKAADMDGDGDLDLLAGNHGLNSRFRASQEQPIQLFVNDFDKNGTPEPILTQYNGDTAYPMVLRHDLVMQLPGLKKKYPQYHDYKQQTINDIFTPAQIEESTKLKAHWLASSYLENKGDGSFNITPLPIPGQFSPVYSILIHDFNEDGHQDALLAGNLYGAKPEVGRYDANYGMLLQGQGDGTFQPIWPKESGFRTFGQVRDLELIRIGDQAMVLVGNNDDYLEVFRLNISPADVQ